ncbi:unnamed protein product [Caretta caretta]
MPIRFAPLRLPLRRGCRPPRSCNGSSPSWRWPSAAWPSSCWRCWGSCGCPPCSTPPGSTWTGRPRPRGAPLALGPQLGRLEALPRLLPHHGLVSSDKASVSYLLGRREVGQVAVIAVGGPPESLDARPGALTLQILGRKGFIKAALQHGAALVPVFSFGENELFQQVPNPRGSLVRAAQERLQKLVGLALPLFHARGVFQYSFGLLPFRSPIHTVVGAPIPVPRTPVPSREAVDRLHATYLERLIALFEENKTKYGVPPEKHLNLI